MTDAVVIERPISFEGFLAFLEGRPTGERWWLDDGTPVMNPLPTRRHDWIQSNIIGALRSHWRAHRPAWRPSGPSQVPVPGFARTVAPDVLVAPEPDRDDVSVTIDPIVVFETLSKNATAKRRACKLEDYAAIASIRHYVVVRQDRRHVTAYHRAPNGLLVAEPTARVIELTALGVSLTLDSIYDATPLAR